MEETLRAGEKWGKVNIAICDDEENVLEKLKRILLEITNREEIPCSILTFNSGKRLLEKIGEIQLVFLDIEMPDLDGIRAGLLLKRKNPDCQIMIASGREDRFKETFLIDAMRFISKPFDVEEIKEAVRAYRKRYMVGMESLELYRNRSLYEICQREIEYVSAYKGGVEVMANGQLFRKDVSLSQFEKALDESCFFRVHKAYIVNLLHVTNFTENEVWMGKVKIPLSRRHRKEFENVFMEFDIRHG